VLIILVHAHFAGELNAGAGWPATALGSSAPPGLDRGKTAVALTFGWSLGKVELAGLCCGVSSPGESVEGSGEG